MRLLMKCGQKYETLMPCLIGILLLQIATLKMTSQVIRLAASEISTSKMVVISGNGC